MNFTNLSLPLLLGGAAALAGLVGEPARAAAIGERARERVREQYLGLRHLGQYADLLERLGLW